MKGIEGLYHINHDAGGLDKSVKNKMREVIVVVDP